MCNIRVRSEERDKDGSEFGVFLGKLEGKSRKDVKKVSAVLKIA